MILKDLRTGKAYVVGVDVSLSTLEAKPECTDKIPNLREPMEATFTVNIDKLSLLSILYGRKITNNWLKMHGGIMQKRRKEK